MLCDNCFLLKLVRDSVYFKGRCRVQLGWSRVALLAPEPLSLDSCHLISVFVTEKLVPTWLGNQRNKISRNLHWRMTLKIISY